MINVKIGTREVDPYSEAIKWLRAPGNSVKIQKGNIEIQGEISKEHLPNFDGLDIAGITNMKANTKPYTIVENGRTSKFPPKVANEKNETSQHHIRKGQVWYVDFGKPVGGEFGYLHPAIVLGKASVNNCIIVFPCSSKDQNGKVFQINFNKSNLKSPDQDFLKNSEDKISHVLIDLQTAVDRQRFVSYCGTLDEAVFQEILKEAGRSDDEIKRNITMESLELTEKQQKILRLTARDGDLLAISNNVAFTYEQRVRGILSTFGFNVQLAQIGNDDGLYFLINLIKNTKGKICIDIKEETEKLSKHHLIHPQTINGMLVELTKKKFKDLHPCLLEFVSLVNKLAE